MAQERDEILQHGDDYDGIEEYDNPLPRWWLWIFYGTVVFAVVYTPYYLLGYGPSSAEMYQAEMAEYREQYGAKDETPPRAGSLVQGEQPAAPAVDASIVDNQEAVAAGREIYAQNCAPCHAPQGQGLIGPNLTDNHWIHGNTYEDILNVVTNGVPDKGMIAWKSTLNPEKIQQVSAFVYNLRGTDPPNPKAPEGQEYPQ